MDVIDLDNGPLNLYWHTRSDTVDKCSPASLAIVGDTVLNALATLDSKMDPPGAQPRIGRPAGTSRESSVTQ